VRASSCSAFISIAFAFAGVEVTEVTIDTHAVVARKAWPINARRETARSWFATVGVFTLVKGIGDNAMALLWSSIKRTIRIDEHALSTGIFLCFAIIVDF